MTLTVAVAAIAAGLMAGVYFAFSAFIMRSFDELNDAIAIEAMNAINRVILRSWFMVLFFGSTLLFFTIGALALFNTELPGRWLLFTTGFIYVSGTFVSTIIFNVPLNNRLAVAKNDKSNPFDTWTLYSKKWTRWNHLRCTCSFIVVIFSLYYLVAYK